MAFQYEESNTYGRGWVFPDPAEAQAHLHKNVAKHFTSLQQYSERKQQIIQAMAANSQLALHVSDWNDRRPVAAADVHTQSPRVYASYSVCNVKIRPNLYGNLYQPSPSAALSPAILCPHGHFADGRFRAEQQQRCGYFASLGFVVFSFSMVGWGEDTANSHHDNECMWKQLHNGLVCAFTRPAKCAAMPTYSC